MNDEGVQSVRTSVMMEARKIAGAVPRPQLRSLVCPYCGTVTPDSGRCASCQGRFDALSKQATQNHMGPWAIKDDRQPFRPGCSIGTITRLIQNGSLTLDSVLRGPSTRQFWMLARHTPGIAHLLGVCHSCQHEVEKNAFACPSCHASFRSERDRQHLGLGPSRPLPGKGDPVILALHAEPASVQGDSKSSIASSSPIGIGSQVEESKTNQPNAKQSGSSDPEEILAFAQHARRWKAAWARERKNTWVMLIVASLLVCCSIAYSLWLSFQMKNETSIVMISELGSVFL